MNPRVWQNQYFKKLNVSLRVTNISYTSSSTKSSDGKTKVEKLYVKTRISLCFFEEYDKFYKLISPNKAKSLFLAENAIDAKCTKRGSYFAYVTVMYQSNIKRYIYVEATKEDIMKDFSEDDIGSFLVNFIKQNIFLKRTRARIAGKIKLFGTQFPCVLKKIEYVKKMKKLGKLIPEKMILTDPEDELSSWIGTFNHHQKEIQKISAFLFS